MRKGVSTIYRLIEKLMKKKGVNATAVAEAIRVDRSTMSRWKHDQMLPSFVSVIRMSDYFEVPIDIFVKAMRKEMKRKEKECGKNEADVSK